MFNLIPTFLLTGLMVLVSNTHPLTDHAPCCFQKSGCCQATETWCQEMNSPLQTTVSVAAADTKTQPICCIKRAYCCQLRSSCCQNASRQ